jgi:hypothetical protein
MVGERDLQRGIGSLRAGACEEDISDLPAHRLLEEPES